MDGRVLLLQELTARKNRNTSYSLRAFARDLGVSPAALSQYLLRKRELSKKNRTSIISKMTLSPVERQVFESTPMRGEKPDSHIQLTEDHFRLISDWVSVATLNLARLNDNEATADWIANRLAITVVEAQDVLGRLLRLKLIEVKNERMQRTGKPFTTTTDIPSEAIRKFHLGVLAKAQDALLNLPVEERDITAITMPTDKKKLAEAKKILMRTRRRIAELVSTEDADEVYVLSFQMFPVSRKKKEA